uniref:Chitin-binding type-2 domain-containing protein n=1 Tax=Caenorhabditis japonica TaxID=281687 RepID=A0A8R1DEA6_CAEJA
MLLQALFMMGIMLNTIQTVIDIRDKNSRHNRENIIPFNVFPEKLTSSQCHIEESKVRFEHYLFETCPTTYDATCNDPMFNKYQEFEFRCRFPTFIYHVRERILLSAPVLQWLQSKCGGPLCDDIYFLFYVVPPRHQNRGAPPPPPAPEAAAPNDDVVELPPLVIDEDQ